ncbi:unnamed protein product [Debaryomyces fabryi]|nr:unnamed protein product [Debaryomyces fabryi]
MCLNNSFINQLNQKLVNVIISNFMEIGMNQNCKILASISPNKHLLQQRINIEQTVFNPVVIVESDWERSRLSFIIFINFISLISIRILICNLHFVFKSLISRISKLILRRLSPEY